MTRGFTRALIAAAALLCAAPAFADGPGDAGPDVAAPPVRAEPVAPAAQPTVTGQSGSVSLLGGAITLNVAEGYLFYPAPQANAFLARNTAPPPRGEVLGMIAPASANVEQAGAWATVLSWDAIGYVGADSATGLTATTLESDVRAARTTQNRRFEGFAAAPSFDQTTYTVTWAERVASPGAGGGDLRAEQKVLARRGVLGLTSVGSADQLPAIQEAAPDILGMISFGPGYQYADFQAASDPVSNYDVPGLVTGVERPQPVAQTASAPTTETTGTGLQGLFPWIAGGVAVLAGLGFFLMRRRRGDANLSPE